MSKSSCLYDTCDQHLINSDGTEIPNLSATQKQHIRRYHKQATHKEGIDGVVFTFRRDSLKNMTYVCPCGSQQACIDGLKIHIRGSGNESMKRKRCSTIAELAPKIILSRKPLYEDKKNDLPFNAEPSNVLDTTRKGRTASNARTSTRKPTPFDTINGDIYLDDYTDESSKRKKTAKGQNSGFLDSKVQGAIDFSDSDQELEEALERLQKAQKEMQKAQADIIFLCLNRRTQVK